MPQRLGGDWTAAPGAQVVNQYTALASDVAAGVAAIQLSDAAALDDALGAALGSGDWLLLYQAQGASIDTSDSRSYGQVQALGGAGSFEFVEVQQVLGNQVELSCALSQPFTTSGHTQVVRVPRFSQLVVPSGSSLTAPAWGGTTGGIVALQANALVLDGTISASGLGFRGGATDTASQASALDVEVFRSVAAADGARKGESVAGADPDYALLGGAFGRGAPANGGGGGNSHNAGGGGGANVSSETNAWTGDGVMSATVTGGAAWSLDPGTARNGMQLARGPGGGRGGYSYSANTLDPLTTAPGTVGWGGNSRRDRGGMGGRVLDADATRQVFFGGGGGAGDGNNAGAGAGGAGGGAVFILAGSVAGTGTVVVDGTAGAEPITPGSDAPGGGGGGGSVVMDAANLDPAVQVRARGGVGGNQDIQFEEAEGPGGGGGGGLVAARVSSPGFDVAGATGGTTNSSGVAGFPSNGATDGAAGVVVQFSGVSVCRDVVAPDTTFSQTPPALGNGAQPHFAFGSDAPDAVGFECSLDAVAFAPCNSPLDLALADGSYTLAVRARDRVGNVDPSPATALFAIDTAPPDTTLTTSLTYSTVEASAGFDLSSSEAATFECSLDGQPLVGCSATVSYSDLALGNHVFEARAIDVAGNADPSPVQFAWVVVTAPPPDAALSSASSSLAPDAAPDAAPPMDVGAPSASYSAMVDATPPAEPDAAPVADAAQPPDAGVSPEAAAPVPDASAPVASSAPAPDAAPPIATQADAGVVRSSLVGGGCACRTAPSEPSSRGASLLLPGLLYGLWWRRRGSSRGRA